MKRLFYIFTFLFVALSAMAANITGGTKLYLIPNSNWKTDNARFAAYFFGTGDAWVDMSLVGDGIYAVSAPSGSWTNVIFCRMNPNTTDNNWDNKWNQTGNLTWDGTKNLFTISGWDGGSWSVSTIVTKQLPENTPIFLKPNDFWKTDNARFAMYCFEGVNNRWVEMKKLNSHSDVYYALLPEGSWGNVIFCRMNPTEFELAWSSVWNKTSDLFFNGDNNCYTINGWAGGAWSVLNPQPTTVVEDLAEGAYYGTMEYKLTIPTTEFNRWHWISLPYDVEISNITSNKTQNEPYNEDFIMKRYDTESRANWTDKSAPKDDKTWVKLNADEKLNAGQGYILSVDDDKTDGNYEITFKSSSALHIVGGEFDREYKDYIGTSNHKENANWYLIGTGLYSVANGFSGVEYVAMPTENGSDYSYYFLSGATENGIFKNKLESVNPYTAFFIQYGGDKGSFKKAPRRAQAEEVVDRYYVNIVGAADTSYTAIFLAEDGSDEYVVGQDFLHFGASGASLQLYTVQGENGLAFNYLQRIDQKVELGGYVAEAGRYTISLSLNSKPASVVLRDSVTGAVVDLLQQNYEFDAEKGKLEGRFNVTITYAPAEEGDDDTTTDLENGAMGNLMVVRTNGGVTVEGLTIGGGVAIYDVAGRCVNEFVAEGYEATVELEKGIYLLNHNGETVKFVVNR